MHRLVLVRALIGTWLLWFTATVVQDPHARVCPIHSAAEHATHTAAAHAAHMQHHAAHAGAQPASEHRAGCDCPDECRCGTPTLPPVASQITWRAPTPVVCDSALPQVRATMSLRRAHALPFANAPPAPSGAVALA